MLNLNFLNVVEDFHNDSFVPLLHLLLILKISPKSNNKIFHFNLINQHTRVTFPYKQSKLNNLSQFQLGDERPSTLNTNDSDFIDEL